jgi:integrase
LIKRGVAITDLQHHLGHANAAITLRIYAHWFRDSSDSGVADKLAQVMVDHLCAGINRRGVVNERVIR